MDKYLVTLAILLLFLECTWLSYDMNALGSRSPSSTSQGQALGEIIKFKSQVKKRGQDSLIWEETQNAQKLFAYDSVLTLNQSSAEITLQGDSHISMNENTMVLIEPPSEGAANGPLRLRFKKGILRATAGRTPQSVEANDYIIEAAQNAKMTIRSNGGDKLEVETLSGEVKLLDSKTMQVAQVVNEGEAAFMDGDKVEKKKSLSNLEWTLPPEGTRVYTHEKSTDVEFQWKGEIKTVEINDKPTEIKSAKKINDFYSWTANFEIGNYLIRLKDDGASTFARSLSVWQAPKIYLVSPLVRQRFKIGKPVSFLWTLTPDVSLYILEISKDKEFKNIIKTVEIETVGVTVLDLPEGELHWRVRGKDSSGFTIPELYENNFYLMERPLEAPKLKASRIDDEND